MRALVLSVFLVASALGDCYFNENQVASCSNPLTCGWTNSQNWICDTYTYPQLGESATIGASGNYYISLLNSAPLSIGVLKIGSGVDENNEQRVTFANTRVSVNPEVIINTEGSLDIDLFTQTFATPSINISTGAELLWRSGRLNVSSILNNGDFTVDYLSSNYSTNPRSNLTIEGNVTNNGVMYVLNSTVIVKDHLKLQEVPNQFGIISGNGRIFTPYFYWFSGNVLNSLDDPGTLVISVTQFLHMFGENTGRAIIGSKIEITSGILLGNLEMNTNAVIAIPSSSNSGVYFSNLQISSQDQSAIIHSFGRCFGNLNLEGFMRITGQLGASIPTDTDFFGDAVAISDIQVTTLQMDSGSVLNIFVLGTDQHTKITAGTADITNAVLTFYFDSTFFPDSSTLIEFFHFSSVSGNFSSIQYVGWEKPNKCEQYVEYRENQRNYVLAFKDCESSTRPPESQFDKKTIIIVGAVVGVLCVLISFAALIKRLQHWKRDNKFFAFKTLKDKY